MDPRSRLWTDLIFPHCGLPDLLALRAVCRAFRHQLDGAPARVWTPLLEEELWRMSHAERVLGWPGVAKAMQRERNTRSNCDAGRCTPGPAIKASLWPRVLLVCGRIIDMGLEAVRLHDVETGALVAEVPMRVTQTHMPAVMDRWLSVHSTENCETTSWLLDCAEGQLVEVSHMPDDGWTDVSVAGPCLAHRARGFVYVVILRVGSAPDGVATVLRPVAHVTLSNVDDELALCSCGQAYLLFASGNRTLTLCDVVTGQTVREFAPLTGYVFRGVTAFEGCSYVLAGVRIDNDLRVAPYRLSDGQSSRAGRILDAVVLRHGDRAFAAIDSRSDGYVTDAATGLLLRVGRVQLPTADTSGALLWRSGDDNVVMAAGHSPDAGKALPGPLFEAWAPFRYGVLVTLEDDTLRVWRFDGAEIMNE